MDTKLVPKATVLTQYRNPYAWKYGTAHRLTAGEDLTAREELATAKTDMKFLCVSTTPLTFPVVPDEYNIAAGSC
jgi:hypothetical protein